MLFESFSFYPALLGICLWLGMRVLWYSPLLFGRGWTGAGYEDNRDTFSLEALVVSLPFAILPVVVMAAVLGWFDRAGGEVGVGTGIGVGFALWLGFAFPTYGLELVDRTRDHGETLVALGYLLVCYGTTGAVLGALH
jgi:hypothetical protein